ncbi:hypothetical protein HK405_007342, partial [Cladochytrium tenue]
DADVPVVIWPEWNDAELAAEKWAAKHAFEDPEGAVVLPRSLRAACEGFRRAGEFADAPLGILSLGPVDEMFHTSAVGGVAVAGASPAPSPATAGDAVVPQGQTAMQSAGDSDQPGAGDQANGTTEAPVGLLHVSSNVVGGSKVNLASDEGTGRHSSSAARTSIARSSEPTGLVRAGSALEPLSTDTTQPAIVSDDPLASESAAVEGDRGPASAGSAKASADADPLPVIVQQQDSLSGASKLSQANRHIMGSEMMRHTLTILHLLYDQWRAFRAAGLVEEFAPWDGIYPKSKDGQPSYNPSGKYSVKIFWLGAWRRVTVDDRVPVDSRGRPLLITSASPQEVWPLILCKALVKVASTSYREADAIGSPRATSPFGPASGGPGLPAAGSVAAAGSYSIYEHGDFDAFHAIKGWIPERIRLQTGSSDAQASVWRTLEDLNLKALSSAGPSPKNVVFAPVVGAPQAAGASGGGNTAGANAVAATQNAPVGVPPSAAGAKIATTAERGGTGSAGSRDAGVRADFSNSIYRVVDLKEVPSIKDEENMAIQRMVKLRSYTSCGCDAFQITVDCPTSYVVSFWSKDAFCLEDAARYLVDVANLNVRDIDESSGGQPAGSWFILFKYV